MFNNSIKYFYANEVKTGNADWWIFRISQLTAYTSFIKFGSFDSKLFSSQAPCSERINGLQRACLFDKFALVNGN